MSKDYGKNWVEITPGLISILRKRKTYFVFDYKVNDGYLLDHYLVKHQVAVKYPKKGEFVNPKFPSVVAYPIRFIAKDEKKVQVALNELYKQCLLFEDGPNYREAIKFISKDFAKEDKESVNDPIYITGLGYDKRWLTDIKIERKYQVQEDENHRVNYAILLLTIQDMNNKLYRIKVSTDQGTYNELNHYFLASNSFVKNQNNSSDNTKHELQNLKDLLDQGIITDEEFEAKKKAILGL